MVDVNSGVDNVRAYVSVQAARGLEHVTMLVRNDRDTMVSLITGVTEDEAQLKPSDDDFSMRDVIEHLNTSFERSEARLKAMSKGEPFVWKGAQARPGGLPDEPAASFAAACDAFIAGEDAIVAVLEGADPNAPVELTMPHAEFGPFNWLEWAVYSHHVHTSDHIGQMRALRLQIDESRAAR